MANFVLEIKCNNACMTDDQGNATFEAAQAEIARLLRHAAERIEAGVDENRLADINGNYGGFYRYDD